MEDKRLVFDTISEHFDQWRERYTPELFDYLIRTCRLDRTKACLEIGPGTGQASDFAIGTGCDYTAIELGSHLAEVMKSKYGRYDNVRIIVDDFEKHVFEKQSYDMVYAAATIQWIREEVAYQKCYEILKKDGYLALFRMLDDYETPNPALYREIQEVYAAHYAVEVPYTCRFDYQKGEAYGFTYVERKTFYGERVYNADGFVAFIQTNADLITIREANREAFYRGIHDAIERHGNRITVRSAYVLDLYRK